MNSLCHSIISPRYLVSQNSYADNGCVSLGRRSGKRSIHVDESVREKGSDENWPDSVVGAVLHPATPRSDGG